MSVSRYRIEFSPGAAREFRKLDRAVQQQVKVKIDALAFDPRPHGVKKIGGSDKYRIRSGDYRILYEIHDKQIVVLVLRVRHRREVYRGL